MAIAIGCVSRNTNDVVDIMINDNGAVHLGRSSLDEYTNPPPTTSNLSGRTADVSGNARSLVDALHQLSQSIPTDVAYTFLNDGDADTTDITYRELEMRSQAIAARLQNKLKPGDRAALVYEPSIDYIAALIGCFSAGVVAVPVYPPDPMRIQRTVTRLKTILDDSNANWILTGVDEYRRFASLFAPTEVLNTSEISVEESCEFREQIITAETLAFLQYTSGSTGSPKGVMLTHANLMFNFEHIKKFDEQEAVAVSWLPMYHDMGLIGLVLQALQSGRRTVLMSPLSFVKRPFNWLKAISRYRAYATSGPSFAYELCVQKITDEEMEQLDLSSWTLACNGAEPIRADTMRRFTERFEPCGFRWETFYPCYGLAEATLIVSGGEKSAEPIIKSFDPASLDQNRVVEVGAFELSGREIVGCGKSVDGQTFSIVNPNDQTRCSEDQVGEIWVRGPGVAQGYWGNVDETNATYNAYVKHENGEPVDDGPHLRTGDMGFVLEGELFVTGRIKDLIIVRGRNHYPQDIERTVEKCHKSLRRDHGAAFSLGIDGDERLVVVQGIVRPKKIDLQQLFAEIRTELLHEHDLAPHAIVLVKCGEIPRTSSGKIQRNACRKLYLDGELQVVAQWNSESEKGVALAGASESGEAGTPAVGETESENISGDVAKGILGDLTLILSELKDGKLPSVLDGRTQLFADLNLESIDLVMLNEMIEQRYETVFPFQDFMAELGRKNQRDISIGQFVEFIRAYLQTMENSI